MSLTNTRSGYGWAAIALHWISAAGVILLYLTGEQMEEAATRTAEQAAKAQHISFGVLLFTFLAARILWTASQPKPGALERNRLFHLLAETVQWLFLAMVTVQIVSGPLVEWSAPRALNAFDWFAIPSPFSTRVEWLHEAAETVHKLSSNLLWPLLGLHVLGALKHLIIDRDATVRRMLWVKP
jgi:cytochrome b561